MKKTLLAAALLAGFAGAAHAQSSVTLYGILDVAIGGDSDVVDSQGNTRSATGMLSGVQSGSRWGLRGSEDLGNGLRVNFQLESGFDVGNGRRGQNERLFGREAWAGLSGNWGEVRIGRQVVVASQYFAFTDPFGAAFRQARAGTTFRSNDTNRADSTVAYFSPNFSGFEAAVGYSFNQNGRGVLPSDDTDSLLSLGLKYANGPLAVALTYEQAYLGDYTLWNGAAADKDPYTIQLGGTWDFNVVKAHLAASYAKHGFTIAGDDGAAPRTFSGENVKSYLVGLSAPVGNGSLFGSWQRDDYSGVVAAGADDKRDVFSVGYTYDLSKRTNLYAYYSYMDGDNFVADYDNSSYAVGIRHRF